MADITDAFAAAFPDGYAVAKPEARAIGPALETALGMLSAAIAGGETAVFATRAALLASSTGALAAYVHADGAAVPERPVQGNNGLWVRETTAAAWSYAATFVLPATVLGMLLDQQDALAAEEAARTAAVSAEAAARVSAITAEATTRAEAIAAEETARIAAVSAEAAARLGALTGQFGPRLLDEDHADVLAADADGRPVIAVGHDGVVRITDAPALLDEDHASVLAADAGGRPLIGLDHDGTVTVRDTRALLDEDYAYAEVAAGGRLVRGVTWDAESWPPPAPAAVPLWIDGGGHVAGIVRGQRVQVSPFIATTPVRACPRVAGAVALWLEDTEAAVSEATEDLSATTALTTTDGVLRHTLLYGQSLSDGSLSTPAVHTTAVRPGIAQMFNAGIRTRGTTGAAHTPNAASGLLSLVDAREISATESPGCGLAWGLTEPLLGGAALSTLVSASGRGGTSYTTLRKDGDNGGIEYRNLVNAARRGRLIAAFNGRVYQTPVVHWIQGENDRTQPLATYLGWMDELQSDLSADIGHGAPVPVILDQISNWTAYGIATSDVPLAQLEAGITRAHIHCVGPKYHLPTVSDGIHLTGPASARLGCYHARAENAVRSGAGWLPLHCTGATREGAMIRLAMHVPVAPLVIDTATVTDPGTLGLTWAQTGGTARIIASIGVDGSDVVVTLSGDPGAIVLGTIGIAATGTPGASGGPATGPRACIRDSAADPDIDGTPMPNWACHQIITVS